MRSATQVGKVTLCVGGNRTVCQFADQLCFIGFSPIAKHFDGIFFGDTFSFNTLLARNQFQHFSFDSRKIAIFNWCFRIYIIVKSVLYRRAYTKLGTGKQLLKRFGHKVSTGMPESMLSFCVIPLKQFNCRIRSNRSR